MTSDNLEKLYQAVIGPKNQNYYLAEFARLDEQWQTAHSWNWPAFFLGFPWLVYRKMWLHALLFFALPFLCVAGALLTIGALAGKFGGIVGALAAIAYIAAVFIWMPGNANSLYHRHCRRKLAAAGRKSAQLQDRIALLSRRGGASIVAAVLVSAFALALWSSLAFAGYQVGAIGAKVARAYWFGANVAAWVGDYYDQHQIMPDNLAQAGFTIKLPPTIKAIDMDSQGAITVKVTLPMLEDRTLRWLPSTPETLALRWTCSSPDIPQWLLPPGCRPPATGKRQ